MHKQFVIFLFIFLSSHPKKTGATQAACQRGFVSSILSPFFSDFPATSTDDVSELEGLCPGLEHSCCTSEHVQKMKEIFEANAERLEKYFALLKGLFTEVSAISGEQMEVIINDLVNVQAFSKDLEDPLYLRFLTAYEYIKSNIGQIVYRLESYFFSVLDMNSAFLCSVCDATNHRSLVSFEQGHLSLKLSLNDCDALLRDHRVQDSFIMVTDIGYLYYFFERAVELFDLSLTITQAFPDATLIPSIVEKLNTCIGNHFLSDHFCQSACQSVDFHGTVSYFDYRADVVYFKLLLDNLLMKHNKVLSDEELQTAYNDLFDEINVVNMFSQDEDNEVVLYKNVNLLVRADDGWAFSKYMGQSLFLGDLYQEAWNMFEQIDASERSYKEEFDRGRESMLSADFTMEQQSVRSGISVDLQMQIMYNHSANSQLYQVARTDSLKVATDRDEDVQIKNKVKKYLLRN